VERPHLTIVIGALDSQAPPTAGPAGRKG